MTLSFGDAALYALALFILFLTPGPVWLAVVARSMSGGFAAAWPLALGVVVGDVVWPFLAILGVTWVVSAFSGFMLVMRALAAVLFVTMGVLLIRKADSALSTDSRLTRPGRWAGFLAGLAAIMGNPKAILFYMGVLPGFFDLTRVTAPDIAVIVMLSFLVPLSGNLALALFVGRARALLTAPGALRRLNMGAGVLLICVGCIIPFT